MGCSAVIDPKYCFGIGVSENETRLAAVTLLCGLQKNDSAEVRIEMVQRVMRAVATRNMKAGLAIGSAVTMMIAAILGLLLQWVMS